jgi:hypothetical protein
MGEADWGQARFRCLVRLYDHDGELVSLHARNVISSATKKGAFPQGYNVGGLVMADDAGVQMLRDGGLVGPLWLCEGVPDFLTLATYYGDAADPWPSVLGIVSASWTEGVAARVPSGARVVIATHHDQAGEAYADTIASTLEGRASLERWAQQAAS